MTTLFQSNVVQIEKFKESATPRKNHIVSPDHRRPSPETQGQIVGRGKVGTSKKTAGEEKSRAKRKAPGENVSPE